MTKEERMCKENRDCHYCEYAVCENENDEYVICYVEDFGYYSHDIEDSREATKCDSFEYCDVFPKF